MPEDDAPPEQPDEEPPKEPDDERPDCEALLAAKRRARERLDQAKEDYQSKLDEIRRVGTTRRSVLEELKRAALDLGIQVVLRRRLGKGGRRKGELYDQFTHVAQPPKTALDTALAATELIRLIYEFNRLGELGRSLHEELEAIEASIPTLIEQFHAALDAANAANCYEPNKGQ